MSLQLALCARCGALRFSKAGGDFEEGWTCEECIIKERLIAENTALRTALMNRIEEDANG